MPKIRVKLKRGEGGEISHIAQAVTNRLIAEQGSRRAFLIARLIHEKAFANYKSMERKYPNEKVH